MKGNFPDGFPEWRAQLLTDPQTSGGLLIACDPGSASEAGTQMIAEQGYPQASIIGRADQGLPSITISV